MLNWVTDGPVTPVRGKRQDCMAWSWWGKNWGSWKVETGLRQTVILIQLFMKLWPKPAAAFSMATWRSFLHIKYVAHFQLLASPEFSRNYCRQLHNLLICGIELHPASLALIHSDIQFYYSSLPMYWQCSLIFLLWPSLECQCLHKSCLWKY